MRDGRGGDGASARETSAQPRPQLPAIPSRCTHLDTAERPPAAGSSERDTRGEPAGRAIVPARCCRAPRCCCWCRCRVRCVCGWEGAGSTLAALRHLNTLVDLDRTRPTQPPMAHDPPLDDEYMDEGEAAGEAGLSPSKARAAQAALEPLAVPDGEAGELLDAGPSPPAAFRPVQEASEDLVEGWGDGGEVAVPEGYYPRSKSVSPVQRKIRELEVRAGGWWWCFGGPGQHCCCCCYGRGLTGLPPRRWGVPAGFAAPTCLPVAVPGRDLGGHPLRPQASRQSPGARGRHRAVSHAAAARMLHPVLRLRAPVPALARAARRSNASLPAPPALQAQRGAHQHRCAHPRPRVCQRLPTQVGQQAAGACARGVAPRGAAAACSRPRTLPLAAL